MAHIDRTELLHENPLARPDDVAGWVMEGDGAVSFPMGRMRMESTRDPSEAQSYGAVLGGGKTGFRQMAPFIAEYANLTVHHVEVAR